MFNKCLQFKEVLKGLKKNELVKVIDGYNILCSIFDIQVISNYKNKKKSDLIKIIDDFKVDYVKYIVMSLDKEDYSSLNILINKKYKIEYVNSCKSFIEYLIDKRILWQKDNLEIPIDIYELIKSFLKDKSIVNYIKKNDSIYKLADGLIIAYGVMDRKYFDSIVTNSNMLDFYYKKDYTINSKMVVSNKLTNKERINRYYKDKNYKKFSNKELLELGNSTYHKNIKSYKKLINILKSNYVFKSNDIDFVDKNIVIPYLYNSINEEDIARKNLEDTINELFEFKGDKLKVKMLNEIVKIRLEFPLWEYRGYTKGDRK